ncbi:aminopeptidase N-like [Temnothorax americanus]|uniref:aminopeptidase N-like n=1 Tax=Temnothorax americanus TaxID=1964332 RepID=UPI004067B7D9
MKFLKSLLHIGLILAIITDFSITEDSKIIYRLPENAKPLHYNIRLITPLEEGNDIFHGEISVIIDNLYVTSSISLHSQDLEINITTTTLINSNGNIYKPIKYTYDNITNILKFYFDHKLDRALYTLNMTFAGNYSKNGYHKGGFIKIPYTDEGVDSILAATLLEPNNARRVFPCFDEPALKATFNVSVMHHQKFRVLSNMPMQKRYNEQNSVISENDMVWTHFNTTPVMSTYLVGIVIVPNSFIRIRRSPKTLTIGVWCKPSLEMQARFIHSMAEKITPLLVEYTNSSEKIPKMDHIIVHDYPTNGMENWGLIIYNEKEVVYNGSTDPTFRIKGIALLITHELVHQWFGNLITPSWWSYAWMSEGFATFFEAYFINKIHEDWRMIDFFVIQSLQESLSFDVGFLNSVTLQLDNDNFEKNNIFNVEVYEKAPALLRMLYHAVGDEVFRKGIIKYIKANQFGSVTPDDLWSAMQSALEEAPYYIPYMQQQDFKIKEVMDTWMNQELYPVLNVTINYATGEVAITQKCVRNVRATESINNKWWIPITYADQSNLDFSNTMPNNWLGPDQTSRVKISTRNWIIVNVQQTAYCRVYYDIINLERIISYLNSEEYTNIHVLNRAQIIDDTFAFLVEEQLDLSVFVNLISYLSRERDYVAWRPMFKILARSSDHFLLPESKKFKSRMVGIFDKLLQHVGYEEDFNDDDNTKIVRLEAVKWACTFGHAECKRRAAVKLSKHLEDPDTHKVLHWWRYWTYCFGLTVGTRTKWDKMMELYQRTHDKQFWKILSCAEDSNIIINYLNITASNTTLFNDIEHASIFKINLENHARNDLVLDYILANFDNIKPRLLPTSLTVKNIILNVFSSEQTSKIKRFAETYFHRDPDTMSNIINLIEERNNDIKGFVNIFTM